jgi:hypothetical protein
LTFAHISRTDQHYEKKFPNTSIVLYPYPAMKTPITKPTCSIRYTDYINENFIIPDKKREFPSQAL